VENAIHVDYGQILSSGGMLAAADLCLHVLRTDLGLAYSDAVARLLIRAPDVASSARRAGRSPAPRPGGSLAPLLDWLTEHLHEDLDLRRVAARADLSTRTLMRHFRAQTGLTLKEWITRRRVEAARSLLEGTDLPVLQVAHTTGFGSAETMRRVFAVRLGISPRDYRSAARDRSWSSRAPRTGRGRHGGRRYPARDGLAAGASRSEGRLMRSVARRVPGVSDDGWRPRCAAAEASHDVCRARSSPVRLPRCPMPEPFVR
jgi:AraC-like DNA-binding protein